MALPTPTLPIVNASFLYASGLNVAYATATTLTLAAGRARNSSNENDIVLSAAVTINAAVNGANGLDSGSLANDTLYAVYVIGDSTGYNSTAGMLSTTFVATSLGALPQGYNMVRRVGAVLTNGSAQILDFTQRGDGVNRSMWYGAAVATDITAGASTTFAAVDSTASVPTVAKAVYFKAALTADAGATRTAALRSGDSSSAAGQVFMSSPASTVTTASLVCPAGTAAAGDTDYLVSNASAALALSVSGYLDVLA